MKYTHPIFQNYSADAAGNCYGPRGLLTLHTSNRDYLQLTVRNAGKNKTMLASRFIYECVKGDLLVDGQEIDHEDRDQKNNCIENLRVATHGQNGQNKRKYKNSTSKYKGVCWHAKKNKWYACITVNSVHLHQKAFSDERQAAIYYNMLAIQHFGQFAFINDMTEGGENS